MTDRQTDTTVPETFDFNETDTKGTRQFVGLATGLYEMEVLRAERTLCPWNDSKDLGIEVTLAPIDASGTTQKLTCRKWFGIPVSNPTVPGHKVSTERRKTADGTIDLPSDREMYFRQGRELLRAVKGSDALPAFPKKNENGAYINPETGSVMEPNERRELEEAINGRTLMFLKELYTQPTVLKGVKLYAGVKRNTKGFANVSYVRPDDGGKEVKRDNFTSDDSQ